MVEPGHIKTVLARIPQIEAELSDPVTSTRPKRLQQLVREHTRLKRLEEKAERFFRAGREIEEHRALLADEGADAELKALARAELDAQEAALPGLERDVVVALLPPDPNEGRTAIMEIRAGTGGSEAALFAGDLFRMYSRYVETRGWKVGVIDASSGEVGGFKEIVFSVEGAGAYGQLQYEGGGHRVQRVPVTESAGRIHTSAATVAVFPEVEPEDDIDLPPQSLRIDLFCSSGPGGQSVNTTYSAVRITHLPTGLVAQSQDERSQQRNREKALAVLKARILDQRRRTEEEKMGQARRTMIGSGDRSERIRTYNFPQNRLTDHRVNLTLYRLDTIIQGDLDEVIEALRKHDLELRLKGASLAAVRAAG